MSKLTRISKVKTVDDGLAKGVHFYVKAAEALVAGNAVYASGAVGNSGAIEVSKYIANNTIDERRFLGICQQDLAINEFGYVLSTGILKGVDTTGAGFDTAIGETWLEGDILFASPTYAGELTKVQPSAPNQVIPCAFVLKKNANGTIAIRAYDLGYHLEELHDVNAASPSDNDILQYNSSTTVWESTQVYSYQYLTWEVNTTSFTGTNYELPAANGGFGDDQFTINSGVVRNTAIDGSVTISLAANLQQMGWYVPHSCEIVGVSGLFRNNGAESNPRDVAVFVGTPDIGTSNASTYTQRAFAAGDDDGGTSNSKPYTTNVTLATPYALTAGQVVMPAVCNSTGSSTVAMQGNFTIIIRKAI